LTIPAASNPHTLTYPAAGPPFLTLKSTGLRATDLI
jgi:hypothetical protein